MGHSSSKINLSSSAFTCIEGIFSISRGKVIYLRYITLTTAKLKKTTNIQNEQQSELKFPVAEAVDKIPEAIVVCCNLSLRQVKCTRDPMSRAALISSV